MWWHMNILMATYNCDIKRCIQRDRSPLQVLFHDYYLRVLTRSCRLKLWEILAYQTVFLTAFCYAEKHWSCCLLLKKCKTVSYECMYISYLWMQTVKKTEELM